MWSLYCEFRCWSSKLKVIVRISWFCLICGYCSNTGVLMCMILFLNIHYCYRPAVHYILWHLSNLKTLANVDLIEMDTKLDFEWMFVVLLWNRDCFGWILMIFVWFCAGRSKGTIKMQKAKNCNGPLKGFLYLNVFYTSLICIDN